MSQFLSGNPLRTATAIFYVESTLRGGHLVRVSSIPSDWTGLYRYDNSLILIARCYGAPPFELVIPGDIREGLLGIIQGLAPLGRI